MGPSPASHRAGSLISEPPTQTPDDEVREMVSVSKWLTRLEADESWIYALILICCLAALVACALKLL